jgi:ABC-type uncharacterized transport system substrate-binding protein
MQRREFITLIGVASVTQGMLPQLACSQASTKRPLLAVLAGVTRELLSNEHVQAVVVLADAMLFQERQRVAELAAAARLPAVYGFRDHVDAGGLISYGVNYAENFRHAAIYVIKILNGGKPSDLPVEFPSKLELVINLKAAKALGLDIPPTLLARADEAIE